ncbi:Protein of unknown function [Fibrobacter sp. UWB15]|uniref:DUF3990 domain-containing protein n=1 Tax=unclassified Fibrobacter TaxID=2634177 RepID=UPI000912A267|nr:MULTISPECIES: DUF3990 domain-containing protein [unclassified Fibrobacter]PWJ67670.1 uncharacterized protein DUF3990 [Fibrobacter sp. UWB6]SHF74488.1 Protein of unknown function [Fibrobacter sp. UWB8]SMG13712.1 Protein of unknown function [Fibrobacter sp. UWB15]SMP52217.1 Protein of unknown function [Fibrobacter sp. UWB10]SOE55888.1 Protein of unknown function [Fibrobacter sp. UWT3]
MIVYHGSNVVVDKPDVEHSFRPLDFGKGFYVTTVREQAVRWAHRKIDILKDGNLKPILNVYDMDDVPAALSVKTFPDDLEEWIDFVCKCRDGSLEYAQYDVIMGKVANDKVFRVVDMYHSGIWDMPRALKEIKAYPTYDQIAFITQKAIDAVLKYKGCEEV